MTGPSVLWRASRPDVVRAKAPVPSCFVDLNLDRVVGAITAGRDEYDLRPFFHVPLADPDDVAYRHEVFRDLEDDARRAGVLAFARAMRRVREQRAQGAGLFESLQRQRLYLDAILTYCGAVARLAGDLAGSEPASRGLREVVAHLGGYVASDAFTAMRDQAKRVARELDAVHYGLVVGQDRVTVRDAGGETDDQAVIERAFARFGPRSAARRARRASEELAANPIEAAILTRVARLFPEPFRALEAFAERYGGYLDPAVAAFDREVQFYLAYLNHADRFRRTGLAFCYPAVSTTDKTTRAVDAYDLALADKLLYERSGVVCNSFELSGRERVFVVTGANQGGKTTFARSFGQLHYLAALGCPVPGRQARLFLCDRLLTHFERQEDLRTLRGKLQDELTRAHEMLESATPASIVIVNETFTSSTAHDALQVGRRILGRLIELGVLGVWVTFVDELASMDPAVVSLVCGVDPDDPGRRTFELARRPADGRAHAVAIARAHRLTYDELRRRLEA